MRGDSLRDFYAKTLAVAGLGLLAGAGAIVDYWPVGGPLPAVTRVAGLDERTPVMLPAIPDRIPAPVFRRTVSHVTALPVASETWAVTTFEELSLPPAPLPVDLSNALSYGTTVELPDLDALDLPVFDVISMADLGQTPALGSANASDDSHGLLSDAMQRTRASLRGARWFLGNKIQGVMGAVKKVSPFWDASGPTYAPR